MPFSSPSDVAADARPTRSRLSALTALARDPALRYLALALALGVGFFGLLRLSWVETHLLLPFTQVQEGLACALMGEPRGPIVVGLSCSAAEVIALCVGAIVAFPVPWWRRLAGAAGGLALIVVLNTVRIGHLGRVAADRSRFELFHVYLWPATLVVAVAIFVFLWMRWAQRHTPASERSARALSAPAGRSLLRLALAAAVLLAIYLLAAPALWESAAVRSVAVAVAGTAAAAARFLGLEASHQEIVFRTGYGVFLVTPECVLTPLLPVYLAAALTLPATAARKAAAVLAAAPIFFVLAAARLLVLVLPPALVGSHLYAVHGFRQLLLGGLLLVAAAWWRSRDSEGGATRRAAVALGTAIAVAGLAGPIWTRLVTVVAGWAGAPPIGAGIPDPQGALLLLPAFQLGLFAGLCVAWGARPTAALAAGGVLALLQPVLLVTAGALWERAEIALAARDLRAWAVVAPLLAAWLAARAGRPARREDRPPTPEKE